MSRCSLRTYDFPGRGFWLWKYQVCFPFCGTGLKSYCQQLLSFINILSYWRILSGVYFVAFQSTSGYPGFIVYFNTMKNGHLGLSWSVRDWFLCVVKSTCVVFSNRILSSYFSGQPTAITIGYIIFVEPSLTSDLCLTLTFYLVTHGFWDQRFSLMCGDSCLFRALWVCG